jgi:hypothetical protein
MTQLEPGGAPKHHGGLVTASLFTLYPDDIGHRPRIEVAIIGQEASLKAADEFALNAADVQVELGLWATLGVLQVHQT